MSAFLFLSCISAWANDSPYFDDHNRVILNGEPFFPIGLYVVQCPEGNYARQLDEIADSPFDTLMNYGVNGCGTNVELHQIKTYLDALQSRDLTLIYALNNYFGHGQKDMDAIAERVTAFKDHPALVSWYLNDELPPQKIPELEKRYRLIKGLDPNHPVWSVHWNYNWLLVEAHTTDIVGVDPYPIANSPVTLVSLMADGAGRAGKPLWLVSQIFDWNDYPSDNRAKTGRPPTYEEMRAMSYLAINHGAKGLVYYSYFNIRDDKDFQTRWPRIKEIAGEIQQLRPIILSAEEAAPDVVCANERIDFKVMKKEDAHYLFAVNTLESPLRDVSFKTGFDTKTPLHVLFEKGRSIEIGKDGHFTDDFGPLEVHIYRHACPKMN